MTQPVLPSPRLVRDQLKQMLERISGVQVVWFTGRRPLLGLRPMTEAAWILASIQSYQSIGIDELRQQYNATTNQNDNILVGQRRFTLVVRAESQQESLQAFDLCERVRFRMRTQTARAFMVPVLSLIDFGPIVQHDETLSGVGGVERTLLAATLDLRMGCVVAADPLDVGEGDWIDTTDAPIIAVLPSGDLSGQG